MIRTEQLSSSMVKARILTEGIQIDASNFPDFSQYKYDGQIYNSSVKHDNQYKVPQEVLIKNLDGSQQTVVKCVSYPTSSLLLQYKNDKLKILDTGINSELPILVEFLDHVQYWSMLTQDNVPMLRIMDTCGYRQANIWLWHDCAYVYDNSHCHYCGISHGMNKKKTEFDLLSVKDISSLDISAFSAFWSQKRGFVIRNVIETLTEALKLDYHNEIHLMFVSGNLPNRLLDQQWQIYCDVMSAINKEFSLERLDAISMIMPPNNFSWIDKAYENGLRKIAFNLEIWNPDLFQEYCPGKSEYSRVKMIDALQYAVNIFGHGNVWTNLIIGVEDSISTEKGTNYLANLGVGVNPIVFHKNPASKLRNHPAPSIETVINTTHKIVDDYLTFGFSPLYTPKSSRTSLANEVYLGVVMIITIDGFAGTGKSAIGTKLAKHFDFRFLSTGVIYRLLTLLILREKNGIEVTSDSVVSRSRLLTDNLVVNFDENRGIACNGVFEHTQNLKEEYINLNVTKIASLPFVREFVNSRVQQIIANRDFVVEGRDTGLIIFPNAFIKFYFVRNIVQENYVSGLISSLKDVDNPSQYFRERDIFDIESKTIPFRKAPDAHVVYPFSNSLLESVNIYEALIRSKLLLKTSSREI